MITFVFDGLQFGGIERVGVEYIKLLRERGHEITVINLRPSLVDMEKELPEDVPLIHINYPRWITPQKYSKLKKKFGFPGAVLFCPFFIFFSLVTFVYRLFYNGRIPPADTAIAFSGHYNDLTFVTKSYGRSVKKIAWLHGDENSYDECAPGFFALYRKIRNLVCLSNMNDEKVEAFNRRYGINKIRIYNPINFAGREIDREKVSSLKAKYSEPLIMVGRLAHDKDQATLIRALAVLRDEYHLDKYLLLVGDGSERGRLEALASDLGLSDRVVFTGSVYDVQNYYLASSVYVHSSPAEGLPTVILEAMFYGLPVVSTDSQPGVREILGDDEYGLISPVGDREALAENIAGMYNDSTLRERYIAKERERIRDFLPDTIIVRLEEYMRTLK